MLGADHGTYWWEEVPGPRGVVTSIVDACATGRSALLVTGHPMPWRESLEGVVRGALERRLDGDLVLIGPDDLEDEGREPGEFLLERYAPRDVSMAYRSGTGKSRADYIVERRLFSNSVIWVRGLDAEREAEWIRFCEGFPSRSRQDGVVLVEVSHAQGPQSGGKRSLKVIDADRLVTRFDVMLYCSSLVGLTSSEGTSPEQLSYRASLLARICGKDIELCARVNELCIDGSVASALDEIASFVLACDRVVEESGETRRELAGTGARDRADLERRVWEAQVESIFPLVERERMEIVSSLSHELEWCLGQHEVNQYGERVISPVDIELGTMVYTIAMGWLVVDSSLKRRIHLLRDIRNAIAHGSMSCDENIRELLSYYRREY